MHLFLLKVWLPQYVGCLRYRKIYPTAIRSQPVEDPRKANRCSRKIIHERGETGIWTAKLLADIREHVRDANCTRGLPRHFCHAGQHRHRHLMSKAMVPAAERPSQVILTSNHREVTHPVEGSMTFGKGEIRP